MYNIHIEKKKTINQQKIKQKQEHNHKYIKNYYQTVRPQLLNKHQIRVNDFVRRMQFETLNSVNNSKNIKNKQVSQKYKRSTKSQFRKNKVQESILQNINRKEQLYQQNNYSSFKFKNIEDWGSLYNQAQRKQRLKHLEYFKKFYDDPNMAFRNINSQSRYNPRHQFRDRVAKLEINPPMKHSKEPSKQLLVNFKSKNKNHRNRYSEYRHNNKTLNLSSKQQKKSHKNNQSLILGDDQFSQRQSTPLLNYDIHEGYMQNESQNEQEHQKQKEQGNEKTRIPKIYFKQVIDLQNTIKDAKTKVFLRNLLCKCGVFRRKIKKVVTQSQNDQFQQFENSNASP